MKEYTVISGSVFHSGKIKLTPDQYLKRSHQVQKVSGDVYEIMTPVSFKSGEIISLEKASKTYLQTLHDNSVDAVVQKPKSGRAKK